ncbi:MAG: sulfur carrier protein ThiS [Lachnospiraceae bacterium]|nr:sulfur carrier protein ThiS [Lachnospiraceae bacterium]
MVKINGTFEDVAGMTILAYLENANYDLKRVVVEKNEEIVPKAEYENVVLCDDDTIEVISFVGGG